MQSFLTALLNTLMGMGTVFVVLIFISLIISLFKYVPAFEQKWKSKKKNKAEEEEISDDIPQIIRDVEGKEELVEDEALVAVITATIMAYRGQENASADRLVVRSVRRVRHQGRRRTV